MATRRQFSREFKLEAVKLVKERGVSVPQAARDSRRSRERVAQVGPRSKPLIQKKRFLAKA